MVLKCLKEKRDDNFCIVLWNDTCHQGEIARVFIIALFCLWQKRRLNIVNATLFLKREAIKLMNKKLAEIEGVVNVRKIYKVGNSDILPINGRFHRYVHSFMLSGIRCYVNLYD